MSKRKKFRRVKVGQMGYMSGKRLQGFRAQVKAAKSQTSGNLGKKKLSGATNTEQLEETPHIS